MNKTDKLYIHKVFFTSKLTLTLLLLFAVIRVLSPARVEKTAASASPSRSDRVGIDKTADLPDSLLANYAEIVERNPFGLTSQITNTNKRPPFNAAVSDELGLALFGTVSGSPEVARAIIKNLKTGVSDLYKIGQTVEGAVIESIGNDEIILTHNGERKILRLNIAQISGNNTTETLSSRIANPLSNASKVYLPTQMTDIGIQTKIGTVEEILGKAVIEPHLVDGRIEGIRLTDLESIEQAKELGLKNGDVIHTVNGHLLTSKQKAHQIFKKAGSQAVISLELLRDNETKKLSFDLQ